MLRLLGSLLLLSLVSGCSSTSNEEYSESSELAVPDSVVYLVRHAEKQSTKTKDPELTKAGKNRAQALAKKLSDVELSAIYSTNYRRTQMTAMPTAQQQEMEISTYYIPTKMLAAKILKLHKKQKILVVGHSNTTPELIAALGVETPVVIEHDQFGDLFIIEFRNGMPQLTLSQFGE